MRREKSRGCCYPTQNKNVLLRLSHDKRVNVLCCSFFFSVLQKSERIAPAALLVSHSQAYTEKQAESLSATHALTLSLVTAHREKNEAANAVKLLLKREWQLQQLLSFFSLPQPVFPFRSVHSHSHFVCIPCLSVWADVCLFHPLFRSMQSLWECGSSTCTEPSSLLVVPSLFVLSLSARSLSLSDDIRLPHHRLLLPDPIGRHRPWLALPSLSLCSPSCIQQQQLFLSVFSHEIRDPALSDTSCCISIRLCHQQLRQQQLRFGIGWRCLSDISWLPIPCIIWFTPHMTHVFALQNIHGWWYRILSFEVFSSHNSVSGRMKAWDNKCTHALMKHTVVIPFLCWWNWLKSFHHHVMSMQHDMNHESHYFCSVWHPVRWTTTSMWSHPSLTHSLTHLLLSGNNSHSGFSADWLQITKKRSYYSFCCKNVIWCHGMCNSIMCAATSCNDFPCSKSSTRWSNRHNSLSHPSLVTCIPEPCFAVNWFFRHEFLLSHRLSLVLSTNTNSE